MHPDVITLSPLSDSLNHSFLLQGMRFVFPSYAEGDKDERAVEVIPYLTCLLSFMIHFNVQHMGVLAGWV